MYVLLCNKLEKAKIKTLKGKIKDADISKWSWKTTVSYLGTKIFVQEIESEHYLKNILRL